MSMTYYKSEKTVSGHEVTVQQVNESGSPSLWIDGYAQDIDVAIDVLANSDDRFGQKLAAQLEEKINNGNAIAGTESLAAWLVSLDQYVCTKCESLYPTENVVQTHFAGHKCGACDTSDKTCDDGGEHDMKCLNPHQKNNARISTKYQCKKCGYKRKTTPTG